MRNPIYVGRVESPDYGVSTKGDFEPLVDEATFYRAQAVLDGRIVVAGPRQRNHPDFPLRGFVRCDMCVVRSPAAGCSSCSSRKGSRSTEFDSIEPP
jgi:hypothetical protein